MRKYKAFCAALGAVALLAGSLAVAPVAEAGGALPSEKQCKKTKPTDAKTKGWCLSIVRNKGNCLACHTMNVNPWPKGFPPGGNIGPPLVAISQRFKDKAKLRAQIWDATKLNPHSVMPPFGKHKLLSEKDIDLITNFILTL